MQVSEWLEGVDIKHKRLKLSKIKVTQKHSCYFISKVKPNASKRTVRRSRYKT